MGTGLVQPHAGGSGDFTNLVSAPRTASLHLSGHGVGAFGRRPFKPRTRQHGYRSALHPVRACSGALPCGIRCQRDGSARSSRDSTPLTALACHPGASAHAFTGAAPGLTHCDPALLDGATLCLHSIGASASMRPNLLLIESQIMNKLFFSLALLSATLGTAQAQSVQIQEPWARATVAGQKATGAFMQLTAPSNMKLVGAKSPVAGVTEIHEMKMDGNTMKMAAIPALALPAGQPVALKPGSYHVMLMDLKSPLKADTRFTLILTFENDKGQKSDVQLEVPVRAMGGGAASHQGHKH